MDKLYKSLHQFSETELRMFLYNILGVAERYGKDGSMKEKSIAEGLIKILETQIDAVRSHQLESSALQKIVHLVFSLSDAGSLKVALRNMENREICRVLAFNELFSVGPISDLDTTAGQQKRLIWMMEHDGDYSYSQHSNPEHQLSNMVKTLQSIPDDKTIVIWCADNAHDQTGLRFALYLLREREQPIHVVNVTELYHALGLQAQDKVIPYAMGLIDHENYEELVRQYYEGFPLERSQRRRYESEWLRLTGQDHVLRLWNKGNIIGSDESALDEMIVRSVIELEHEQDEYGFIKAGSVVTKVFEIAQQLVGYSFITYRIWILVNQGILTFRGLPGALHQFSLKLVS